MKIGFYEEFPTKENLGKIKLIDFSTDLIIAANSVYYFNYLKNLVKKHKNIKEVIYWPILDKDEGYWFSAFAKNSALKRIMNELQQNRKPLKIMWDAELPFYKSLILKNMLDYFKNRKLILDFFKNAEKYNIKIMTSEYPLESKFFRKLLFDLFLISFDPEKFKNRKIAMLYSSFLKNHPNLEHFLENQIEIGKDSFEKNFVVALGTIAAGINGDEPILSPQDLERDLRAVKNNGVNEVFIFRLGGLTGEYVRIIKKFL